MQATQELLIKQVGEVVENVAKVFPQISFKMPKVGFFYKSRVAGRAYFFQHKVEFNAVLAKENKQIFMNTVIHEVAHLVTRMIYPFSKAHGPEFKSVMQRLGGDGERCHNYDVSSVSTPREFEYKCSCMNHKVTARKHANMQKSLGGYHCVKCKGDLVFVGKQQVKKAVVKKVAVKTVKTADVKAISTKGNYENGTIMYCEKRGKYVAFHDGKIEVRGATVAKAKALYIEKFGFPVQFIVE